MLLELGNVTPQKLVLPNVLYLSNISLTCVKKINLYSFNKY